MMMNETLFFWENGYMVLNMTIEERYLRNICSMFKSLFDIFLELL